MGQYSLLHRTIFTLDRMPECATFRRVVLTWPHWGTVPAPVGVGVGEVVVVDGVVVEGGRVTGPVPPQGAPVSRMLLTS